MGVPLFFYLASLALVLYLFVSYSLSLCFSSYFESLVSD